MKKIIVELRDGVDRKLRHIIESPAFNPDNPFDENAAFDEVRAMMNKKHLIPKDIIRIAIVDFLLPELLSA